MKAAPDLFGGIVYDTDLTEAESRYLNALYTCREQWSRSRCPVTFDAGMRTSQRSDAFHSLVKRSLSKRTTLPVLLKTLLDDVASREDKRTSEILLRARQCARVVEGDSALVAYLAGFLTNHAFGIVLKSYQDSINYEYDHDTRAVAQIKGEGKARWTIGEDGRCSCKDATFMGLPCTHIFTYARVCQVRELPAYIVLPRWHEDAPLRVVQAGSGICSAPRRHVPALGQVVELEYEASVFLREFHALKGTLYRSGMLPELLQFMRDLASRQPPLEEEREEERAGYDDVSESLSEALDALPAPPTLPSTITEATVIPERAIIGDPAIEDIKKRGRPPGKGKSVLAKVGPRMKSHLEKRGGGKRQKSSKA